jgi:hypothetical protein
MTSLPNPDHGAKHPAPAPERRPDYETWLRLVDEAIYARVGLSLADLPDCCYRDLYDDGLRALAAARKVIRAAGWED